VCLAQKTNAPSAADGFADLANSALYARTDEQGTLRRDALLAASGYLTAPNARVLSFLDKDVTVDGLKRSRAVHALSRIGTPEATSLLWQHVFNTQSSVIPESLRDIYLPNFAMELGEFRNRPAVLSFLLNTLYYSELKNVALRCITEDVIERSPEYEFNIKAAPLNQQTPNSVALAQILSKWLIKNAPDLHPTQVQPVSRRITSLLGVPVSPPATNDRQKIRAWVTEVFRAAVNQAQDVNRKKEVQAAMGALE